MRRAKLYYLRERVGKGIVVKEKVGVEGEDSEQTKPGETKVEQPRAEETKAENTEQTPENTEQKK